MYVFSIFFEDLFLKLYLLISQLKYTHTHTHIISYVYAEKQEAFSSLTPILELRWPFSVPDDILREITICVFGPYKYDYASRAHM